jgi:YD repeat-containing protein
VIGVDDGDRQFRLAYDGRGRLQRVDGPDGTLVASWVGDNLVNVTAPDRDDLRVSSDGSGRLSGVQWDDDTAVTLDWSVDGSNLVVSDGDEDAAQHYRSIDGVLTSFSTDGLTIDSTQQDSGYLQTLTFSKGDDTGQIRFDQVGRPSVLSAGEVTSSFTYDENGRIAAVLAAESGEAPKQSAVTYDDGRHIEGDKQLVEALFDDDGGLRASLPSSLPNPVSAAGGLDQAVVAAASGSKVLQVPEPRPLDEVEQAIAQVTPDVITPLGVRDLSRLAERMIMAEVTRRSPAWKVNGDTIVHAPIIDPENGSLAEFNPFVDAAPTGLVLGLLSQQVTDDSSLFDRALDTIGDIVGGVYHFAKNVVLFVANNPITRFIVTAGASLAVATCTATVACITIAAVAMLVSLADNASSAVSAIYGAVRACGARDLVRCGLSVVAGAVEVAALAGTVGRVTSAFTRTYFAQRLLAAARASGVGIAQASGRVGMAKSELLAVLRMQRVIAREVPVCASRVCARVDLVTRDFLRRVHLIEVKHGAAARFTANQQIVYPLLSSSGGYLPAGLAGAGPQAILATIEVQHWGAGVPLALP